MGSPIISKDQREESSGTSLMATLNEAAFQELARLALHTISVTAPLLRQLAESLPAPEHPRKFCQCQQKSAV